MNTHMRIACSSITFAQAVQAALHPRPVAGGAEARVDEHRVVHRRPLDGGAAPAEPARVASRPLAGAARHRELPLVGVGEGAEGADGDGGGGGEEEEAAAEVRRQPPHRLQLPPDTVAGASPSASHLHARRVEWWWWGRVLSRPCLRSRGGPSLAAYSWALLGSKAR
uniref:Uncharacterized protein n=1 Tax=Arundo donax TaxID=35708 RepID=A0A0A9CI64_ARUDO